MRQKLQRLAPESIKNTVFRLVFVGLLFAGISATNKADAMPTLIVNSGQLLGANNVDLGSLGLFDVRFADGSCADLFTGCDNAADDFAFQNEADATVAAQALLDQVFVDLAGALFSTDPELTNGCEEPLVCQAMIPFSTDTVLVNSILPTNFSDLTPSDLASASIAIEGDLTSFEAFTFAVFSPVPEPPVMLLFSLGVIGLAVSRRRRRH